MREPSTDSRTPSDNSSIGAFVADLVLFAVSLAAVLVAFFYLPIGVVAAVAQDGITEDMRTGLGASSPLPLRFFKGIQALTAHWPLAVGAALLHVALRWLVRRRSNFGDSLAWDSLISPLLTTVVVAVLRAAWVLATGKNRGLDSLVGPGALIGVATFVALGITGLLLALARRHRGLRLALAGLLLVAAGVRVGAEVWGRASLRSHRERRAVELAGLDAQRAARERPVLRGAPIDENAWPRYQKLLDDLRSYFLGQR